ncbi:hypothetical protein JL720_15184 [Aureococcus anophagefferens]|nr:hypothetical protein JL720_15184 [Aureococcus anophagefferens]
MVKFLDKLSDLAKAALGQKSGASYDARVVAESQKRYESLLRDVERIFPGVSTIVLATIGGDVLAAPAPPSASKAAVDDSEFEDIPAELRALDDEMTAGDLEFDEFLVGVTAAYRVSRIYVAEALTPDRPKRPKAATVPRSPLFRAVGARVSFWVYGVDDGHVLAFHADAACHAIDSTDADARVAAVVDNIRVAMRGAATARRPVPRRKIKERPWTPGARAPRPRLRPRVPDVAKPPPRNHPSDYAKPPAPAEPPKRPSSEPPKPPPSKPPT